MIIERTVTEFGGTGSGLLGGKTRTHSFDASEFRSETDPKPVKTNLRIRNEICKPKSFLTPFSDLFRKGTDLRQPNLSAQHERLLPRCSALSERKYDNGITRCRKTIPYFS